MENKSTQDVISHLTNVMGWKEYSTINDGVTITRHFQLRNENWDLPLCFCNDKPPSYNLTFVQYGEHGGWRLNLIGETQDEQWVELSSYAISTDKLLDILGREMLRLEKAWIAVNS